MITKVPTYKDSYNPKIDYRLIAFSDMKKDFHECSLNDYMVYLGKIQPDNPLQVDMCKTKKAFELLKMKGVSIDIVDQCADMFKLCFNAEKINRLKEFLFQLKMEHPFDDACELFMFIVKKKIFNEWSQKFAILLFNAILVQHQILPIIFYPYYLFDLCELVESGITIDSFKELILQKFSNSIHYNTAHELIDDEEVTKRVKKLSEELKSKYGVIHLTITGSFAKKTYTQYSDLDVILEMSDYKKIAEAEAFIQEKIKIPVDAIQANDSFTRLSDLQTYRIEVF